MTTSSSHSASPQPQCSSFDDFETEGEIAGFHSVLDISQVYEGMMVSNVKYFGRFHVTGSRQLLEPIRLIFIQPPPSLDLLMSLAGAEGPSLKFCTQWRHSSESPVAPRGSGIVCAYRDVSSVAANLLSKCWGGPSQGREVVEKRTVSW
jgi:hypothetical protein